MIDATRMTPTLDSPQVPRLRVLISAFALAPDWGSEPGVGWNICTRLAKWHDVTVVTCPGISPPTGLKDAVQRHFDRHGPVPGLTLHYVEPKGLVRFCLGDNALRRYTVNYWAYARWQWQAFEVGARLHRENPFDIVHHLNIIGFREPGFFWRLNAPFVWGPVGGACDTPAAFLPSLPLQDAVTLGIRAAVNRFQKRYAARAYAAAKKASRIWVVGAEERQMFGRWGRPDVETMLPVGSEFRETAGVRSYDGSRPLKLAWVASHIGRKALPIALEVMSRVRGPVELTVVGSGPRTAACRRFSQKLGIDHLVRWTGQLPFDEVTKLMAGADVFIHTAIEEGGPTVVAEALSLGLPVICHHAAGMAEAVDESCGVTIPLTNPRESVEGFAAAVQRILDQPATLERLSRGALVRAAEDSWEKKTSRIASAYSLIAQSAPVADS